MLFNRTLKRDKLFQQTPKHLTAISPNALTEYQLQLLTYKQSLAKDIHHPRIRELIMNHQRVESLLTTKSAASQSKQTLKNNLVNLQLLQERKWLTKKGKRYLIDFDDAQRKQMKDCFNAMDTKKTGSIGIDQLQELLISVGLMDSRDEVKQLIDSVDEDMSGKIEFSQFLKMILNDEGENQEIVQFFKFIIHSKRTNKSPNKHCPSKSHSNSKDLGPSPPKHNNFLQQNKQNVPENSSHQKSSFHQERNKLYSSPENKHPQETVKKNSALNIFEKHPHPKSLPFGMIVSHIRRKHMMTALKVNQQEPPSLKKNKTENIGQQEGKSNHYISSSVLRSSQNMKESKTSASNKASWSEEEVTKGQSVMNALRKMWDRRLLREIKERKSKKLSESKIMPLTKKGQLKNIFPSLS